MVTHYHQKLLHGMSCWFVVRMMSVSGNLKFIVSHSLLCCKNTTVIDTWTIVTANIVFYKAKWKVVSCLSLR